MIVKNEETTADFGYGTTVTMSPLESDDLVTSLRYCLNNVPAHILRNNEATPVMELLMALLRKDV